MIATQTIDSGARLDEVLADELTETAAVELVRPLVLGQWPAQWLQPLGVLAAYAAVGYYVALVLTRRRFYR